MLSIYLPSPLTARGRLGEIPLLAFSPLPDTLQTWNILASLVLKWKLYHVNGLVVVKVDSLCLQMSSFNKLDCLACSITDCTLYLRPSKKSIQIYSKCIGKTRIAKAVTTSLKILIIFFVSFSCSLIRLLFSWPLLLQESSIPTLKCLLKDLLEGRYQVRKENYTWQYEISILLIQWYPLTLCNRSWWWLKARHIAQ